MSPRLLIAAVATLDTVAAIPGASASTRSALTTPVASASAPAAATTSITLGIVGCRACPVRLVQAHSSAASAVWHTRAKRVHNGHVTFAVPVRRTVGMTFELNPRWSKASWVTNVVTRYKHRKVGSIVTPARAARTHRAEACEAGTNQSRVRMVVREPNAQVSEEQDDALDAPASSGGTRADEPGRSAVGEASWP